MRAKVERPRALLRHGREARLEVPEEQAVGGGDGLRAQLLGVEAHHLRLRVHAGAEDRTLARRVCQEVAQRPPDGARPGGARRAVRPPEQPRVDMPRESNAHARLESHLCHDSSSQACA